MKTAAPRKKFKLPLLCCLVLLPILLAGRAALNTPGAGDSLREAVCRTAQSQIGAGYSQGGASPATGFDCSGLVIWTFNRHGISMPRMAQRQATYGKAVKRDELKPGDVVVFKLPSNYHSGIYTGQDKFIHSPGSGKGVREDRLGSDYWNKYYLGGRRVID